MNMSTRRHLTCREPDFGLQLGDKRLGPFQLTPKECALFYCRRQYDQPAFDIKVVNEEIEIGVDADPADDCDDDNDQEDEEATSRKRTGPKTVKEHAPRTEGPKAARRAGPKVVKRGWSEAEKAAVMEHFIREIHLGKIPGKKDIDLCKEQESALQRRFWRNIKDFIRNTMKSFKTKQSK